jgi:hypothetical protein
MDVIPTVAELLHTRVWWRHDGQSVFSVAARARDRVAMQTRDFSRVISFSKVRFERRRHALRLWRASKYGTGEQSELIFGDPWASAYRIGPHPELIGRRVGSVATGAVRAEIANAALVTHVEPSAEILPTRVTGRLPGTPRGTTRDLAVAVNGRIRAVGRSFHLRGRQMEFFSLLVPETALRPGRNRLEVLEVRPGGSLVRL